MEFDKERQAAQRQQRPISPLEKIGVANANIPKHTPAFQEINRKLENLLTRSQDLEMMSDQVIDKMFGSRIEDQINEIEGLGSDGFVGSANIAIDQVFKNLEAVYININRLKSELEINDD